jgi:hypothetical protein
VWTSLEAANFIADAFLPLIVLGTGYFLNQSVKRLEQAQWTNQKLVEKRLQLYDELAPLLNRLFCFYMWIGYWKDVSPKDVLEAKRTLDREFNIYRHLLSEELFRAYNTYSHVLFTTYSGPGEDAKIRSLISGLDGNRRTHRNYEWDPAWENAFTASTFTADKQEIEETYFAVMEAFRRCLGIDSRGF